MPGAYRKCHFTPRYVYQFSRGEVYGTWAFMAVARVTPIREAGVYALESTAHQNHYEDTVWVTEQPFVTISPGGTMWRQEGIVRSHPMFRLLVAAMNGPDLSNIYRLGNTDPVVIIQGLLGPLRKTMYVLSDYSGAIDAWLREETMAPGSYAHFRLLDIRVQADWYLCRSMQFLG